MFEGIIFETKEDYHYGDKEFYDSTSCRYVRLLDTDFCGDWQGVIDTNYIIPRLVIIEYNKRNLDVLSNLKIWVKNEFGYLKEKSIREEIITSQNYLNKYYPYLLFNDYAPCLQLYVDRLKYIRAISA